MYSWLDHIRNNIIKNQQQPIPTKGLDARDHHTKKFIYIEETFAFFPDIWRLRHCLKWSSYLITFDFLWLGVWNLQNIVFHQFWSWTTAIERFIAVIGFSNSLVSGIVVRLLVPRSDQQVAGTRFIRPVHASSSSRTWYSFMHVTHTRSFFSV